MNDLEQIMIRLSEAFGPSGFEMEVRETMKNLLDGHAAISYDNLGSILATRRGQAETPRVLLAAHMDEVGLMVRGVLPGGYLKVVPLGSWWSPSLIAQQVLIRSQNGDHRGVIGAKPPHYLKEDEKNRQPGIAELYIDVGAQSQAEVSALGIKVGDPVVPAVHTEVLSATRTLVGKAFDDRAGCVVLVKVLQELTDTHPNQVIGAGTVQEEVGLKGARALANLVQPDICIVLEGAPADDFPDAGAIVQGKLGAGPQIRRYDPSMIANQHLVDVILEVAEHLKIPHQVAVREGGGTDGSALQVQTTGGVPTVVIGVPVRYAHSHHGILHLGDLAATVNLIKAVINRLDAATVNQIKLNPWAVKP
ncbi:MAG TPA: M42 family metallopeptidase [Bacillota bacterium]|nr:M42 family metallopeptidase [Bacillota bacterium]